MEKISSGEIIEYLKQNKVLFHERFGVTRIGIFGSFARGEGTPSSDIDMVVEMEKDKKIFVLFCNFEGF